MEPMILETVRTAVLDAMAQRAPSPWLDSEGAADYLACTPGTLKTWRARGEGPHYHVVNGKMVRYHVSELDAFVRGEVAAVTDLIEKGGRADRDEAGAPRAGLGEDSAQVLDRAAARDIPEPSNLRPELLQPYAEAGYELIPLHGLDDLDAKGCSLAKVPIGRKWQQAPAMDLDEAQDHMTGGQNVGVRLRDCDLVIDVDPRNFARGDDPIARLSRQLGIAFDDFPTVITGSDGLHIYMRKPPGTALRETVSGFEGVEFKTVGRQVVAAGSLHPHTRRPYVWDPLTVPLDEHQQAPVALLEFAARSPAPPTSSAAGSLSPEELEVRLSALDPCTFRDEPQWRGLMMACHHATGGAGREEFITWSTSDPDYAGHEGRIGRRWDSLKANRGGVTQATLFKALKDAGRADLIPRPTAAEDFDDDLDELDPDAAAQKKALLKMNAAYFTVLTDGKFLVGRETKDPFFGHLVVEWFQDLSVKKHLNAEFVPIGDNKQKSLGAWWLSQPERRQFEGVIFDPTPGANHEHLYNLWRGWGVSPEPGCWSRFRQLVLDVLCRGDEASFDYIVRWMAFMVQKPHVPAEVALVFKGPKGVGKGTFARALCQIAGPHGRQVAQAEHFTGRFNHHLSDTIFLFVDEGFWAGNKQHEGALKNLITEPVLTFEGKYKPIVSGPNRLHVAIASNEAWVVPASNDERRFAVFEADAEARSRLPRDFFQQLNAELDGGGLAGLLHDLLSLDLQGWHPRADIPQTDALMDQKVQGFRLDPLAFWWHRKLEDGHSGLCIEEEEWLRGPVEVGSAGKDELLLDLLNTSRTMGGRGEFTKAAVARFLRKVGADVQAKDRRGHKVWRLPPLAQARVSFETWAGGTIGWEGAA